MGGAHSHPTSPETQRMRLVARALLLPLAVATFVAMLWLWPGSLERELPDRPREERASVTAVDVEPCAAVSHGGEYGG